MAVSFSGSYNLKKVVAVVLGSASLWLALFSIASAEQINSFAVEYEIKPDSSVLVTETITYDFGQAQRHGIFRNVKDEHPQTASAWYKERYVDVELLSVRRSGQPEPYTLQSYDGMSAKIGRADTTITGEHTYEIVYVLRGALSESGDEIDFYWNVTGDEWPVTIRNISVNLVASGNIGLATENYCYAGVTGSKGTCTQRGQVDENQSFFIQNSLPGGNGLTISQRIILQGSPLALERYNLGPFIIGLVLLLLLASSIYAYRWKNKYKTDDSIIAQYEPLKELGPMMSGVLMDKRLDSRDITAAIIFLAQSGFISIKKTERKVFYTFEVDDFEVTLMKPIAEAKSGFHRTILGLLFDSTDDQGAVVKLSDIKKDQKKLLTSNNNLRQMRVAIDNDVVDSGYFEKNQGRLLLRTLVLLVVVGLFASFTLEWWNQWLGINSELMLLTSFVLIIIGVSFSIYLQKRRTRKGYEALNYLKGFKDFLSITEKERYKFHNDPALSPEKFMEYLPYAIAFGVEEEWAEVFKDIQITTPDWYSSSKGESFSATSFTSSLGAFSASFVGSTASSSSSSGGGSSGGGGGGGGGGSW